MTLPLPPRPKITKELIPAGNHVARLYKINYVGTVWKEDKYGKRQVPQIMLDFELCNERRVFKEGDEPRPLSISTRFETYSMGEKSNLYRLITGITGPLDREEAGNFNPEQLLGEACLLNVVHNESNGTIYANIQGLSPLPKGMTAPPIHNEPVVLDVNEMSQEAIENLSATFIKDKMKSSEEYDRRFRQIDSDKEIPFD